MLWIESHADLENHPKVFDLTASMGWTLDQTIGKLHRFWWWCARYAPDGDLKKHNDNRIASSMGVAIEDSKRLIEAMVASCWIDREPYFRVHDWWDYFGPFLQIKYKHSAENWKKIRALYKNGEENSSLNSTPDLPDLPDQPTKQIGADRFLEIWKRYPNKAGKEDAQRRFLGSVKNEQNWAEINSALDRYLKTERVQKGFIQDGSRWFGKWRDWLDYGGNDRPRPAPPPPPRIQPGKLSPCHKAQLYESIAGIWACQICRNAIHPSDWVESRQ